MILKLVHGTTVSAAVVGIIALMGIRAHASQVTLTDVDGTTSVGEYKSLSLDQIVWESDGEDHTTPLADLAQITFHHRLDREQGPRPCMVFPKAGGQLSGTISESIPDGIILRTSFAERLKVPFSDLRAITFEKQGWLPEVQTRYESAIVNARTAEDILLARSEKADDGVSAIPGVLVELGPTSGEFHFNDRTRRIRVEKIYALIFAASLETAPTAPASVELTSGDMVPGSLVGVEDNTVSITTTFQQAFSCSIDDIESLTLNNDRIVYLDAIEPHSHSSSGVVHKGWTHRKNRNVFNKPMRMDAIEYEHGIGVHAHSEIQYRLDGAFETFAATIGLDDSVRPNGNVRFKVVVDGKVAYDSKPMSGSDRAMPVNVSVSGVEWMTLVVESAEQADIGDWANWAAARLIKPKTQS